MLNTVEDCSKQSFILLSFLCFYLYIFYMLLSGNSPTSQYFASRGHDFTADKKNFKGDGCH
jgi:hypothetical protein